MVKSPNLELPFVEAAQAQKHVTVNESLVRLDALSQLVLESTSETVPPGVAADGIAYAVPEGAQPPWQNSVGHVVVRSNGGWITVAPRAGWRAWVADINRLCVFDGANWLPIGASGSGPTSVQPIEFELDLVSGEAQTTAAVIPAQSCVIGVTARVVTEITGTLSSWRLGVIGSDNRYGSGFGLAQNSFVRGLTSAPLTYYSDTPLLLSPESGSFDGGTVRFIVHTLQLGLPDQV